MGLQAYCLFQPLLLKLPEPEVELVIYYTLKVTTSSAPGIINVHHLVL